MSLFNLLDTIVDAVTKSSSSGVSSSTFKSGAINYGNQKIGGGHDHRTNTGDDRTPAQKKADQAKRKKD